MSGPPRYLLLLRAALAVAAVSLLAFGLAHMAFITWVVDRSEDPSLLLRLGLMLGAPMMVGALPALASAALGAYAWRRAWGTPLASWRWGPVLATALLPGLALNLVAGPSGGGPPVLAVPLLVGAVAALPALAGALVARSARGALAGLAPLPVGAMLSMFLQAERLAGWTLAFVVAVFAIFAASGWLMERALRRAARKASSPGAVSDAP